MLLMGTKYCEDAKKGQDAVALCSKKCRQRVSSSSFPYSGDSLLEFVLSLLFFLFLLLFFCSCHLSILQLSENRRPVVHFVNMCFPQHQMNQLILVWTSKLELLTKAKAGSTIPALALLIVFWLKNMNLLKSSSKINTPAINCLEIKRLTRRRQVCCAFDPLTL